MKYCFYINIMKTIFSLHIVNFLVVNYYAMGTE